MQHRYFIIPANDFSTSKKYTVQKFWMHGAHGGAAYDRSIQYIHPAILFVGEASECENYIRRMTERDIVNPAAS